MLEERIQKKIDARQASNQEIVKIISDYVEKNPSLRFWQILAILGIVQYDDAKQEHPVIDAFYEESVDLLKRIKIGVKS